MSYKTFANDFKKGIAGSFLFFHGAEDYLMTWAVDTVKDRYVEKENRSYDIVELEGDSCDAGDIISAARSYSMFSERRVVIVRNYSSVIKKGSKNDAKSDDELISLAGEANDSSIVIFLVESRFSDSITAFGKKLMKACSAYEFSRLEKAELAAFISKRIHAAGKNIGRRELQYLMDVSGYFYKDSDYSLYDLNRDLIKITQACEVEIVDAELIEELIVGADDKFVFNLIDALMAGNNRRALELAASIMEAEDNAMMILSLVTKQFELMYDALELADEGYTISAMAKEIGVNEYRFKKAWQAAKGVSRERIKRILIHLYNTDRDIKTGRIERNTAIELFAATV